MKIENILKYQFDDGDKLVLDYYYDYNFYYNNNINFKANCIILTYLSVYENGYATNQSDIFLMNDLKSAIEAFWIRLLSSNPIKSNDVGLNMNDINDINLLKNQKEK